MHKKQLLEITRNPIALMKYHTQGKLPRIGKTQSTPLRELIESIPSSIWTTFQGVVVDDTLGFNGSRQFNNLHQVALWLGYGKTELLNKRLPYQSWSNKRFRKRLFIEDLIKNSASTLPVEQLQKRVKPTLWQV